MKATIPNLGPPKAGPCKDCDRRTITCHGECAEYLAYRKVCEEAMKLREKELRKKPPRESDYFREGWNPRRPNSPARRGRR